MAIATFNTSHPGHKVLSRRAVLGGIALWISPQAHMALPIATIPAATPPAVHPVLALPFIRDTSDEERAAGANPRCFWHVAPTGNYGADCATGAEYAALATDYMVAARSPHLLPWVVIDMISMRRPHSGIEVGFLSAFGRLAVQARAQSTLVDGVAA